MHAVSFLVRLWREPREVRGEEAPVRVYLRNLKTGEESYMVDPARLGERLVLELETEGEGRSGSGGRAGKSGG